MAKNSHCSCEHPILCICERPDTIMCKLSDFDLVELESDKSSYKKWERLHPNPGGSQGMIAPEV